MTKYARYHANRRARLIERLGTACAECFIPDAQVEIDHIRGGGNEYRSARGNAGEISRLLSLPDHLLHEQAQLLCPPCHKAKTAKTRIHA